MTSLFSSSELLYSRRNFWSEEVLIVSAHWARKKSVQLKSLSVRESESLVRPVASYCFRRCGEERIA